MSIRFCEFCSSVHHADTEKCPHCGARLIQSVAEVAFNDSNNPWPFLPVNEFRLRIQGQPRKIIFSGTHSVYHLWTALHNAYRRMELCWRVKQGELELVAYPPAHRPKDFTLLDPGTLLNCQYRQFTFHTYEPVDPAIAAEPGQMQLSFQGNFDIEDCPPSQWGIVLGWLVATAPRPAAAHNWTYDI